MENFMESARQKLKVLNIIRVGGRFGDWLETNILFEINGQEFLGETIYFGSVKVANKKELKSYENKDVIGSIELSVCRKVKKEKEGELQIKRSKPKTPYDFFARIISRQDGVVLLDLGVFTAYMSLPSSFKIGDFVSGACSISLWNLYFGEISHSPSIPKTEFLKNLDRSKWLNDCSVLKVKERKAFGELDILVKCEKTEKPFSVSVKTNKKLFEGQKVRLTLCENYHPKIKEIYVRLPPCRPGYGTLPEDLQDWQFINGAIGEVKEVFEFDSQHSGKSYNVVVVDVGNLLIETLDKCSEKLKTGDFVRLGICHVCTEIYGAETGEKINLD